MISFLFVSAFCRCCLQLTRETYNRKETKRRYVGKDFHPTWLWNIWKSLRGSQLLVVKSPQKVVQPCKPSSCTLYWLSHVKHCPILLFFSDIRYPGHVEYILETTICNPLLFAGLKESRASRTLPRANTSESTATIARRFHTGSSLPSLSSESRRGVRIIRWTYIAYEDWRGAWLSVLMRLHESKFSGACAFYGQGCHGPQKVKSILTPGNNVLFL